MPESSYRSAVAMEADAVRASGQAVGPASPKKRRQANRGPFHLTARVAQNRVLSVVADCERARWRFARGPE